MNCLVTVFAHAEIPVDRPVSCIRPCFPFKAAEVIDKQSTGKQKPRQHIEFLNCPQQQNLQVSASRDILFK